MNRFPALNAGVPLGAPGGAEALGRVLTRAAGLGCAGVVLRARWDRLQPRAAGATEFGELDRAAAAARARGLAVGVRVDTWPPPAWLDAGEFAARDERGEPIVPRGGGRPALTRNSKQVRDWTAAVFKALAAHFGAGVGWYEEDLAPAGPFAERVPLDRSRWAAESYRAWLRRKFPEIRDLNAAWDAAYAGWEDVAPGEGVRRSTLADYHLFRYATVGSWCDALRKAVREARPDAGLAAGVAPGRWEASPRLLGYDVGRYARAADVVVAEEVRDPWFLNMMRAAAEVWGGAWAVRTTGKAEPPKAPEDPPEDVAAWGRSVLALGGGLVVEGSLEDPATAAFVGEAAKQARLPAPQPHRNRQAVYASAAEAQFWDGTDHEEARGLWMAVTEAGRKPVVDPLSDGMFAGAADALKRYTAAIEVPFAKVIARDARQTLVQVMKAGQRVRCHRPETAGVQDEHGKPQPPLVGP